MLNEHIRQSQTETPEVVTHFELPPYEQLTQEVLFDRAFIDRIDALARPKGLGFRDIEDPEYEHPIIMCRPTLTSGIFALRTQYAKTVVLVNYATGTTPDVLTPIIERLVENEVPVFLVADCPSDKAGITTPRKYGAAIPAIEAGAIPIEKVNVRDVRLVNEAVKDWSDRLSGRELGGYIGKMFAYQDGEKKPSAEWETPGGIERYQMEIVKPFLTRLGIPRDQISTVSKVWKTCSSASEYTEAINRATKNV